jgi:hypothetical protein
MNKEKGRGSIKGRRRADDKNTKGIEEMKKKHFPHRL